MTHGLSSDLVAELTACAHAIADAARPATLAHFRIDTRVTDKGVGGFDPVTEGDRTAEREMRDVLARLRPEDGILGEEFGAQAGTTGLTWVLDPIDGTRAYIAGAPTWGVLAAVCDDGGPILGLIDQPHIAERFFGGPSGARVSGPGGARAIRTRAGRPLGDAILMTTFPEVGTPDEGAAFARVAARAQLTRYGLDCYAYALLALGQVDLVIEAQLQPYDIAGPMAVVQGAGGIVTDWQGGPAQHGGRVIAAANAEIHAEALALLG